MADNRVVIVIQATGGSEAANEFAKAISGIKGLESEASKTSSSLSKLDQTFATVTAGITALSAAVAIGAAKLGSDYQKAINSMSETFKTRTAEMVSTAQSMSDKLKHVYDFTEVAYAFQKTSDSMQRYGITGEKYLKLVERAADIGAAKNLELKESIDRIESAMRGEAEASEYLGVTLNDTYMKNMAFNGALKESWEKLSDNEKAAYRYKEMMDQTAKFQGAAERSTQTLTGALNALSGTVKDSFGPVLKGYADELTTIVNKTREWYEINEKVKSQGRVAPDPLGLTAMYEPGPEKSNLTWGGLKAYEAQQRENEAKAHGNALAEQGKRIAEQEAAIIETRQKALEGAATAQERYVYKYKELMAAWPYGGSDFEKAHAKIWDDLLKATQEKTTKAVSSKIDSNLIKLAEWVARYHGISEELFKALIKQESQWDTMAKSPKGAMGLTQLMPGTASDLGVKNAWDPLQNMMGGATYLKQMLEKFGDVSKALAAYNAGPKAVEKYGGVPPYAETQKYVSAIMTQREVMEENNYLWEKQNAEAKKLIPTAEEIAEYERKMLEGWYETQESIAQVNLEYAQITENKQMEAQVTTWLLQLERDRLLLAAGTNEEYKKAVETLSNTKIKQEEMKQKFGEIEELGKKFADNMQSQIGDALYNMFMGKFDDIGKGFAEMLARMAADFISSELMKLLKSAFSSDGLFGGLFGGGGGSCAGGVCSLGGGGGGAEFGIELIDSIMGLFMHQGGLVGNGGSTRPVSPLLFAGAPRLHGGLAADEFPAILQSGETVLPRGARTSGTVVSNVNVTINQAGGMTGGSNDQEQARKYGQVAAQAARSEIIRVIREEMRFGGVLYKGVG